MSHKDIAGTDILVGQYVVYAATWGRCATLKYGKVVSLTSGPQCFRDDTVSKIQCVTTDRNRGGWFVQGMDEWALESAKSSGKAAKPKVVTLAFLDRLQVLPPGMLPNGVKKLLDNASASRDAS